VRAFAINRAAFFSVLMTSFSSLVCLHVCFVLQLEPTGAKVLWVEVSNTDERYLSELYSTVASRSPDYAGIEDIKAVS
jgi:hypothetical protein